MRLILVAIFVFGFLAWDISQNNGQYTHNISAYLDDIGRSVRRMFW
jgi:hypothetical protein